MDGVDNTLIVTTTAKRPVNYADQAMGGFIELTLSGPSERLLHGAGTSKNQAFYGALIIGMVNLVGGATKAVVSLSTKEALEAALQHLGPGYVEVAPGVFKSADGTKLLRMTESELEKIGNHAGAPHMNFETEKTVIKPNGKETFINNKNEHVFLPEER